MKNLGGEATKFSVPRKTGNRAGIFNIYEFFFPKYTHSIFLKKNSVSSITQNKYKFTSRAIEYFIWGKHHSLTTRSLRSTDCKRLSLLNVVKPHTFLSPGLPGPLSIKSPSTQPR